MLREIDNEYEFIPTARGKHLLMVNGYTYSQMKLSNNYYCSKKQSGNCKARVKLDEEGKIINADYNHTHPPPTYVQTPSGRKRSYLWNFFVELSPNVTRCKLCGKKMSKNMARHIRNQHPKIYRQMRKYLETKNLPKNRRRSTSWVKGSWAKKYCDKVSEGKYQCNICDAILSLSHGLFGNMKRHIKSKHPYIYEKEVYNYSETDGGDAEVENTETEEIEDTEETALDSDEYLNEFIEDVKESMKNRSEKDNSNNEEDSQSDSENPNNSRFLDEDDPEFETKIKYLVSKQISGKKRAKNCFWNFFNVIEENHLYSCLACNRRVAIFPHSIANLKRHIRMKHKQQYEIMMKYMNEGGADEGKSSPVSFEKCYFDIIEEGEYKCKECGSNITSNDTTALFDHIKDSHPDQILAYQAETIDNEEEYNVVVFGKAD